MAQYRYERTEDYRQNTYRGESSGSYSRQVQAPMGGYGRNFHVVDGTAARVLEEQPEYRERRYRSRQEMEETKARERRMPMNLPTVLFLAVAMICTACICILYVCIQNNVTVRTKNIATLEKQYAALVEANDAMELNIQQHTDYAYVYKVATEELGMQVPTAEQIRTFQQSQSEYVVQYEEIPEAE